MGKYMTGFIIVFCFSIPFLLFYVGPVVRDAIDDMYYVDYRVNIVTDKWIKNAPAFLIFGQCDKYFLEINNNYTVEVDDFEYYNTNIGDYRNETVNIMKDEYKKVFNYMKNNT